MFGLFGKKKKQNKAEEKAREDAKIKQAEKIRDYSVIPEMTRIMTNGNEQAVEDMLLLAKDQSAFIQKYKVWCDGLLDGITDKHSIILVAMAYWLTGYGVQGYTPPFQFGEYIDWKEETEEILEGLKKPIETLGYPLDLNEIEFSDDDFTDVVLQKINDYCTTQGYALVTLDTGSDCYHLFIVKANDLAKLIALGKEAGIRLYNSYL